jgi:hypothetical protein
VFSLQARKALIKTLDLIPPQYTYEACAAAVAARPPPQQGSAEPPAQAAPATPAARSKAIDPPGRALVRDSTLGGSGHKGDSLAAGGGRERQLLSTFSEGQEEYASEEVPREHSSQLSLPAAAAAKQKDSLRSPEPGEKAVPHPQKRR